MRLYIEKEARVDDLKKMFTACYPFLKIEFYKKQLLPHTNTVKKEMIFINSNLVLPANSPDRNVIDLDINRTVAEVEADFASMGLFAEVFRKSGNVWVETSLTSDWTLRQQNLEGEEITRHFQQAPLLKKVI